MTLTIKMQEGDKTPPLYNFYEDQYNFNDLSRAVDSGMNDLISTLKYGRKYEREFREAVANIMAGVKDGTITFNNGRYNDALGRYSNDKDKNKDVYGWAANYVYNNMLNMPKYKLLTNTKKYNNTILGRELANIIFGSDNGNLLYLWDVDTLDPETNLRGITGRLSIIQEAIPYIDIDNLLKDYSDKDRANVRTQLQQVTNALSNGQIDPGETLTLSKVFGGIDWNNWLRTDFSLSALKLLSELLDERTLFYDYINTNHPLYNGELTSITLNKARYPALEENAKVLASKNNNELQQLDINKLDNDTKLVYLNTLISRNLLPTSDNLFILPNTLENETVLTFDPNTNTLARKRTHELSYYRKQWINDYNQQYGNPEDNLALYFTEFKKNGGILKAQTGVKFSDNANWYSGVFTPQLSHILQGLKSDSNYYTWLNDMLDMHGEIYRAAGNDWQNTAYRDNLVGRYQNLYKSGYNNEWKDNPAGYNSLGILNAQNLGMFDVSGRKRTSGDWNGNGNNWNTDGLYSAITDYRRLLGREGDYTPELLKYVTTLFNNAGYNLVKDANNYYKLVPLELTLKPVIDETSKLDKKVGSDLFPRSGTQGNKKSGNLGYFLSRIAPDLLGAGRLFYSLRTNNKVADILNKSLRPVLKDTYERYSPITGAFSEMLFRNRQAADLRRQASRPFTSDASLQLAGLLEANRQARDLEYQGFLADDKEIKRTQEAALARQEDNMARRSDVANFNRASINQTNREKSLLEATRLRRNWLSVDNFLQNIESRLRLSLLEKESLAQQVTLSEAQGEYQRNLDLLDLKFKNAYPDATINDMLNNTLYVNAVKGLRRRLQYDNNNIILNNYRVRSSQTPYTYPEILNRTIFAKKGGSLRPSIMSLINKVIDNENNS